MTTNKLPMVYAAEILSTICDEIDGTDKIDEFLIRAFDDAKQTLAESVDRRIMFDTWSKIQMEAAQEAADQFAARAAKIKAVRERFRLRTKEILESLPEVPYAGKLGKISIVSNGGLRAIEYSFGSKHITPATAELFGVPEDYILSRVDYFIDTERVRAELENGKTLEWAKLAERGTRVSFPQNKKPKQTALEEKE